MANVETENLIKHHGNIRCIEALGFSIVCHAASVMSFPGRNLGV